jgi:hypothetical protein
MFTSRLKFSGHMTWTKSTSCLGEYGHMKPNKPQNLAERMGLKSQDYDENN